MRGADPSIFALIALLFAASILGSIGAIRHFAEGGPYHYPYSAVLGTFLIAGIWIIGGRVVHDLDVAITPWLISWEFDVVALALGFAAGIWLQMQGQESLEQTEFADLYYKFAVLPVIAVPCIFSTIVVVLYGGMENMAIIAALYAGYGALFLIDNHFGLLDAIRFMREHPLHHRRDAGIH